MCVYVCVQVEVAAAGVVEVARVHACFIHGEHAKPRGTHHTRHEHRPAVHEGPGQPYTRYTYTQIHTHTDAHTLKYFQKSFTKVHINQ